VSRLEPKDSGILATLDPSEAAVLAQVIGEIFQFVAPAPKQAGGAEWANDLGLSGLGEPQAAENSATAEPPDPITARLFPAAYKEDDEAAGDFRRFTEDELRAGKAAHADRLLKSLPEGGGSVLLDDDDSAAWLGALNDARLALGTALEVTEDYHYELVALEPSDERAQRLYVYVWLNELQGSLLDALMAEDI
jgi:hypothetical protein